MKRASGASIFSLFLYEIHNIDLRSHWSIYKRPSNYVIYVRDRTDPNLFVVFYICALMASKLRKKRGQGNRNGGQGPISVIHFILFSWSKAIHSKVQLIFRNFISHFHTVSFFICF